MTHQTIQFAVSALASACFAIYIYRLASHRLLSFRYTIGWLSLCGLGIFSGLFLPILGQISRSIKVTPAAIIAVGALVLLMLICVQLSIAISNLQERTRTLAERISHLQFNLEHRELKTKNFEDDTR